MALGNDVGVWLVSYGPVPLLVLEEFSDTVRVKRLMVILILLLLSVPAEDIEFGVDGNDDGFYSRLHTFAFELEIPPFKVVEVYDNNSGRRCLRFFVISPKNEYELGVIDGEDCTPWFEELRQGSCLSMAVVSRKWIVGVSKLERILNMKR